jgi:peptidoglycan/xylan/chitin deacetylase (PgdA/CDA1 family)
VTQPCGAVVAALLACGLGACGAGGDQLDPPPLPPPPHVAKPRRTRGPRQRIDPLRPARRRYGAQPQDAAIPILMYHVVTSAPAGVPYPELWVPARRFAAHMRVLRSEGYHAVTLGQVWAHWHRGLVLPRRPVVISFDDGYLSQWAFAARTLRALRWPGVLNLTLKHLGTRGGLSRRQVRELVGTGWELDSHTLTHRDLTTLAPAALHREVAGSRARLQRLFHVAVPFFCYPSGRYDARVEAAVRAARYRGATTTRPGVASPRGDPYALPRIRVSASDTPATLVQRLRALPG